MLGSGPHKVKRQSLLKTLPLVPRIALNLIQGDISSVEPALKCVSVESSEL